VKAVFPRVQFFALLSNGRMNVAGRGQGVVGAEEQHFFNKMNFIEGGAMGAQRDGLVLGVGLARALGVKVGDNLTVMGQTIDGTINAIDARVTGIFQVGMKEADDTLFQVQLSEAQILLNTRKVESVTIGLDDEAHWDELAEGLNKTFPAYEALSIYVLDQVWAENGERFLTALLNIFRLVFLGMILLAIYNSASNTVLERKRELGMLRANGESPQDLIQLLVLEGLYLAVAGATLGILMTVTVHLLSGQGIPMPPTPGTNRLLPVQLHLDSSSILLALMLGVLTSTAATFLSTLQVLRLSIVQAIRAAA
jgi:putative ABC transport system permease protein